MVVVSVIVVIVVAPCAVVTEGACLISSLHDDVIKGGRRAGPVRVTRRIPLDVYPRMILHQSSGCRNGGPSPKQTSSVSGRGFPSARSKEILFHLARDAPVEGFG